MYNKNMSNDNRIILLGVLGSAPRITETTKGLALASLSVATKEFWKDATTGEDKTKTQWHRVITFESRLVESLKNAKTGDMVYVVGSLSYRTVGEESEKKTLAEIVVNRNGKLVLLGKRFSDIIEESEDVIEDSIPF